LDPIPNVTAKIIGIKANSVPQLLVINVGVREKVQVDDLFYISRAGKLVGQARVVELATTKKSRCMARIIKVTTDHKVMQGDTVTTLPPKTGT
jgi:hypothetical protein